MLLSFYFNNLIQIYDPRLLNVSNKLLIKHFLDRFGEMGKTNNAVPVKFTDEQLAIVETRLEKIRLVCVQCHI